MDLVVGNFAAYRLVVDGAVERPHAFTLAELYRMPQRTQITRHDCVEGWSAIGKWSGVPLARIARRGSPARRCALRRLPLHGQRRFGQSLLREPRSPSGAPSADAAGDALERRAARSRSRRAGAPARADAARLQERQVDRAHRGGRQFRATSLPVTAATGRIRATSGTRGYEKKCYIRKTPNCVRGCGACAAASRPIAITRRVSSGSMMPSSHRRAVE